MEVGTASVTAGSALASRPALRGLREQTIAQISTADVESFITSLNVAPKTRNPFCRDNRTLWSLPRTVGWEGNRCFRTRPHYLHDDWHSFLVCDSRAWSVPVFLRVGTSERVGLITDVSGQLFASGDPLARFVEEIFGPPRNDPELAIAVGRVEKCQQTSFIAEKTPGRRLSRSARPLAKLLSSRCRRSTCPPLRGRHHVRGTLYRQTAGSPPFAFRSPRPALAGEPGPFLRSCAFSKIVSVARKDSS